MVAKLIDIKKLNTYLGVTYRTNVSGIYILLGESRGEVVLAPFVRAQGHGRVYPPALTAALVLPAPRDGSGTAIAVFGALAGMHGVNSTFNGAFAKVTPVTVA